MRRGTVSCWKKLETCVVISPSAVCSSEASALQPCPVRSRRYRALTVARAEEMPVLMSRKETPQRAGSPSG